MTESVTEKIVENAHKMVAALTAVATLFATFLAATFHDNILLTKMGLFVFFAILVLEFIGLTITIALAIIIAVIYYFAMKEALEQ